MLPIVSIIKNWHYLLGTLFASVFFVFFIFNWFIKLKFIYELVFETSLEILLFFSIILLFVLLCSWKKTTELLLRYKNKTKLEKPPFVYLDYLIFFIFFSVILILLFQTQNIKYFPTRFKIFSAIQALLILIWFISAFIYKKELDEKIIEAVKSHLSDEPIQNDGQDLLNRKEFVNDLYKEIKSVHSNDSFVFGLYGEWGEGKTSIVNLLKNRFNTNKNSLLINFDPWNFNDVEAILKAFYKQIENEISKKYIFPNLKKKIQKYQKLILSGIATTGINIDLRLHERTIEEMKSRIETLLVQNNIKVLILIDNLDRLPADDILFIFKLTSLNTNFKNTIFLLCFDQILVERRLNKEDIKPEFIEKIIQKPIQLPKIEQRYINQFMGNHIEILLEELELQGEEKNEFLDSFSSFYLTKLTRLFKTLRYAKRYLNSLRFSVFPIKTEINLYDFFIFEMIKVFYPGIYNDIWENPWFYIPMEWSKDTMFMSPFGFLSEEEKKNLIIKNHIEDLIEKEVEKEILKNLLGTLFFIVNDALKLSLPDRGETRIGYRLEKRITHPESFMKYYMLKVPSLEIPDAFIMTTLDVWNLTKKSEKEKAIRSSIFQMQEENKLKELFRMLTVFSDKISEELSIYIIKIIYSNADKFSREGGKTFMGESEYDNSLRLFFRLLNDKVKKSQIAMLIEESILNSPNYHFIVLTVLYCKKDRIGSLLNIFNAINIGHLKKITSNRLKGHFIDNNLDVFEEFPDIYDWGFILFQWATNWNDFSPENKKLVGEYLLTIFKKDFRKLIMFLRDLGLTKEFETKFINLGKINKVCNLSEINELLIKLEDNSLSDEDRNLVTQFLDKYSKNKLKYEKEEL